MLQIGDEQLGLARVIYNARLLVLTGTEGAGIKTAWDTVKMVSFRWKDRSVEYQKLLDEEPCREWAANLLYLANHVIESPHIVVADMLHDATMVAGRAVRLTPQDIVPTVVAPALLARTATKLAASEFTKSPSPASTSLLCATLHLVKALSSRSVLPMSIASAVIDRTIREVHAVFLANLPNMLKSPEVAVVTLRTIRIIIESHMAPQLSGDDVLEFVWDAILHMEYFVRSHSHASHAPVWATAVKAAESAMRSGLVFCTWINMKGHRPVIESALRRLDASCVRTLQKLRIEKLLPPQVSEVLLVCNNPDCQNMSGPSELAVKTFACGGDGCESRFCSRECQAMAWRLGHRDVCPGTTKHV